MSMYVFYIHVCTIHSGAFIMYGASLIATESVYLPPVSQVCVGKEREERVRLELRVTELEEEMETQTTHMTSVK